MLDGMIEPTEPQTLDDAALVPREPYSTLLPSHQYLSHLDLAPPILPSERYALAPTPAAA